MAKPIMLANGVVDLSTDIPRADLTLDITRCAAKQSDAEHVIRYDALAKILGASVPSSKIMGFARFRWQVVRGALLPVSELPTKNEKR